MYQQEKTKEVYKYSKNNIELETDSQNNTFVFNKTTHKGLWLSEDTLLLIKSPLVLPIIDTYKVLADAGVLVTSSTVEEDNTSTINIAELLTNYDGITEIYKEKHIVNIPMPSMFNVKIYKYSQFNIDIHQDGKVFVYNTLHQKGCWISEEQLEEVKGKEKLSISAKNIIMYVQKLLVPMSINESTLMNDDIEYRKNNKDLLEITVAVTRACNYKCIYCFEQKELAKCNEVITAETIDSLCKFIKDKMDTQGYKRLSIGWFGGEPLLNVKAIKEIANKLKDLDITFVSHMTTNGRFATKEVIQDLHDSCNLMSAQITLDGLAKEYAELKGCTEDDFYTTIQNIKDIQDIIKVTIRLNVGGNSKTLIELLRYIDKEKIKAHIYMDRIKNLDYTPDDYVADYENYLSDYKEIIEALNKDCIHKDLCQACKRRGHRACQAQSPGHYDIDCQGNLYKCVENIFNADYAIGNINTGEYNEALEKEYTEDRLYDKCTTCAISPVCHGKCTVDRKIRNLGINCDVLIELYKYQLMQLVNSKVK